MLKFIFEDQCFFHSVETQLQILELDSSSELLTVAHNACQI